MSKIKLIAIDMDGTLLNDQQVISPENKAAIKAADAAGIQVVLASGRPLNGLRKYLEELNLWSEEHYTITFNGALVQENKTNATILEHTIPFETFQTFYDLSKTLNIHIHAEDKNAMYTPNKDINRYTVLESALVDLPLFYRPLAEFEPTHRFSKVMMIDDPKLISAAGPKIPEALHDQYYIVNSTPYFIEVMNKNVSKGNAIAELASYLNIQQDEIMAIGDERNDLTMLEYAGTGVAMGNAVPQVKAIANKHTTDNNESGVGKAIQTIL
ncbi:sugar-phosphatase [Agrilactobacillus yilanensis]|uniref:Sugar-phosphatase n=1 Tax=Agrilactobacillus yilanensis TaxID=2485997 RepID=A0ABW4J2H1_9LACO|nr:sugar-phosphatase [Agrilactobacillus yilanensis]